MGIKEADIDHVLNSMSLKAKKLTDWSDDEIIKFLKSLRKVTKPMIIAANKADLCEDLDIVENISDNFTTIPCSAETELMLRKAAKSGLIQYVPGGNDFQGKGDKQLSEEQDNALHLAKNVLTKIGVTGIQKILNSIIFDTMKLIVVYPVEDES